LNKLVFTPEKEQVASLVAAELLATLVELLNKLVFTPEKEQVASLTPIFKRTPWGARGGE